MFNKIKKYKLIVFQDNDLNIREINTYKLFFMVISLAFIFLSVILVAFYSTDIREVISFSDIRRQEYRAAIDESLGHLLPL